ncbi:hypothetical protein IFM61606_04925 [Aspergillus udagawae]|uniref:Uncharacterized protein n=1 Tax=Aspergillus udagawae TaxID=91492 RepID=A0ABQ1ACI2_9EURO|nr:hypothetical protein IFM53868_02445 [Aspergillus udagawae]GFG11792.1 hypothetical protein IFM5058_05621 [Aspergillus udagawae]GFG24999.1 hypothetical protein IFM61606_04925 [Aspergillus udagawae]
MRCSIVLLLTAVAAGVFARPAASARNIINPHLDISNANAKMSVLDDPGYIAAWESVTGKIPANAPVAMEHDKRAIGPIQGFNNYVALYYRKGRYVVTLVFVSNIHGGLADGFVNTPEIASAIATSARDAMAAATGLWASTSWGFYSTIRNGNSFTVVAKNILPRGSFEDAQRAARALADRYGFNAPIFWAYPQNNKRDESDSSLRDFHILAEFTPSVTLADYLLNTFHNVNHTAMAGSAGEAGHLSKRDKYCFHYNEKERAVKNMAPWNTENDIGCIGQLSDFD